ncbi:MAG: FeoB-associated Cys-rich membrane protein [Suilimivivens sp.]
MGTVIVGAIVLGIVALAIRSMVRDKKAGKSLQCGGDCKHCKGHCH